jgi:hypothetical protein
MRQGIGSIALYNIIIVFIVITFGFLMATLSYVKAFKVNGRIASIIEKYEGYNSLAEKEITTDLNTIGYQKGSVKCPTKMARLLKRGTLKNAVNFKSHVYCIYEYPSSNNDGYFNYGIVTYIYVDIPIIGGKFKLPIYSETESIFNFSA